MADEAKKKAEAEAAKKRDAAGASSGADDDELDNRTLYQMVLTKVKCLDSLEISSGADDDELDNRTLYQMVLTKVTMHKQQEAKGGLQSGISDVQNVQSESQTVKSEPGSQGNDSADAIQLESGDLKCDKQACIVVASTIKQLPQSTKGATLPSSNWFTYIASNWRSAENIASEQRNRCVSSTGADTGLTDSVDSIVLRSLPGLIDEIISKNRSITHEELCDAVHQTNSNKRQKGESESLLADVLQAEKMRAERDSEERSADLHQEDLPRGRRKATKRRQLELKGRRVRDTRKRSSIDSSPEDAATILSDSSSDRNDTPNG
ncbi:hypothetical protein PR202_ga30424 [Eleusine coracana subsp. coracana]|uniref:DUF7648 domain-containing protein n=1 Tax=Eleusine coracana subsp. coracana TaxID=191504 RepID=A0AAV5DP82_ELECO|nr:hypothetical protein PR202_ga30424 [Eleusine coracana subsp. coracana]